MADDFTVTGDELDRCLDRAEKAEAEVERLRAVIVRAHEQLSKHDYKGPKQITRALMTLADARRKQPPA